MTTWLLSLWPAAAMTSHGHSAHVLARSQQDFRPSYLMLSELRDEFPGLPVIAMTATATKDVQRGIIGESEEHGLLR